MELSVSTENIKVMFFSTSGPSTSVRHNKMVKVFNGIGSVKRKKRVSGEKKENVSLPS